MACGVDDDEDVIFGLPFSNFWLRLLALRRPGKKKFMHALRQVGTPSPMIKIYLKLFVKIFDEIVRHFFVCK